VAIARYNGDNTSVPVSGSALSNLRKSNNTNANILLSPNPVQDVLRIEGLSAASSGLSSSKTISIIDATGKLLKHVTTASESYSFDVKQLPAGIYLIRVTDGDKMAGLKFIKQ
jgi:hypothetical protein